MEHIVLIGGGGHCKSTIDVIEKEGRFIIAGIVDKKELLGSSVLGYPVIGKDSDLEGLAKKYKYGLVTAGQIKSAELRIKLFYLATEAGFEIPSIVSPMAYVSKHASIGRGNIVMHHALINANVIINDNCIINSKALIEHDTVIESHCHISTYAAINGNVRVERGSFIGSRATTKESIIIPQNSFIKSGSLVK